jgi:hypothetical protein
VANLPGKHFTRSFGCMYGVKIPENDPLDVETEARATAHS